MTAIVDLRPAECHLYARPGSDIAFTVIVRNGSFPTTPTVTCFIGTEIPAMTVTGDGDEVTVAVSLTDTQTTELGIGTKSWWMYFESNDIDTPILTGTYKGSTGGNTTNDLTAEVVLQTGTIEVTILSSGGGGGGGSMTASEILTAIKTVDGTGSGLDADTLDGLDASAFTAVSYTHTQASAATTWTINHNLGFRPVVETFTSGGVEVEGSVTHTSVNQVVVQFSGAQAGSARLV